MFQINCEDCGASFEAKTNNRRFCDACNRQRDIDRKRNSRRMYMKPPAEHERPQKPTVDLVTVAVAARKAGMTYGKYVAAMKNTGA